MGGNVFDSYGADNFQLEQDYQIRLDQAEVGQPEVFISCDLSSHAIDARIVRWRRYVQIEEAAFRYVGMSYAAAQDCADDMRSAFTYNSYQPWIYEDYLEGSSFIRGWHQSKVYTPQLESTVNVVKDGRGEMYDVVVNARLTLEAYALNRNADTGARPLYATLQNLDGWNADAGAWENGYAITAAGADNIQLVTAPSYRDDWELVGENVLTINAGGLSGISFDDWYKVTTTYTAAVKYDGMTLAACRSLYGSLNNGSTGWYLSSNPWVLSAYRQGETFKLDWVQDTNAVIYQCLNRATMQRTGGKMWSVELQLEARTETMKKSGSTVTHTWPGLWQRIPAIQRFL